MKKYRTNNRQMNKLKMENQKLDKSNKELKENLKKTEVRQKQLQTDNEQLIKEKCSVSKQALILEENNRSLRSIVSYLELEDQAKSAESTQNERSDSGAESQRGRMKRTSGHKKMNEVVLKNDADQKEGKAEKQKRKTREQEKDQYIHRDRKQICWYYENTYCDFGDECRNVHRDDWEIDKDRMAKRTKQYKQENRGQKRDSKYRWWDENSACLHGDSCGNPHRGRDKIAKGSRQYKNDNNKYCWWDENKKCNFGDRCRNSHRKKAERKDTKDTKIPKEEQIAKEDTHP